MRAFHRPAWTKSPLKLLVAGAVVSTVVVVVWAAGRRNPSVPTGAPCPAGSIIAFGDSITLGTGLPRGQAYPEQAAALLGEAVCNAGVAGDTTREASQRLDNDVLRFAPRTVVVLLGTNDSGVFAPAGKAAVPLVEYRETLARMVERIRASGAAVILLSLPPLDAPRLQASGLNSAHWYEYDRVIRSLASAANVPLVDMTAAFSGDLALLHDGVHPNAAGAKRMAQAVSQAVRTSDATRPAPSKD